MKFYYMYFSEIYLYILMFLFSIGLLNVGLHSATLSHDLLKIAQNYYQKWYILNCNVNIVGKLLYTTHTQWWVTCLLLYKDFNSVALIAAAND